MDRRELRTRVSSRPVRIGRIDRNHGNPRRPEKGEQELNGLCWGPQEACHREIGEPTGLGIVGDVLTASVAHGDPITHSDLVRHPTDDVAAPFARIDEKPAGGWIEHRQDHAGDTGAGPDIHTHGLVQNAACGRNESGRMLTNVLDGDAAQDTGRSGRVPCSVKPLPIGISHHPPRG